MRRYAPRRPAYRPLVPAGLGMPRSFPQMRPSARWGGSGQDVKGLPPSAVGRGACPAPTSYGRTTAGRWSRAGGLGLQKTTTADTLPPRAGFMQHLCKSPGQGTFGSGNVPPVGIPASCLDGRTFVPIQEVIHRFSTGLPGLGGLIIPGWAGYGDRG